MRLRSEPERATDPHERAGLGHARGEQMV